jgi:WD40 repeat protein
MVTWSPDSRRLASNYDRKMVHAWAAATGQRQFRCPHHEPILALAWSPNDDWLATITRHQILLWATKNEDIIEHPNLLSQQAQTLAWSYDSEYLATSNRSGMVQVYGDLTKPYNKMKCVQEYRGHAGSVSALAWAPAQHRLATAGYGQSVHVWNALTGNGMLIYQGHTAPVTSLAWSPDGSLIASASRDGDVRVWKSNSGAHVYTYEKHSGPVTAVAWSPDGTCIASGDEHRRIHIWQAPS